MKKQKAIASVLLTSMIVASSSIGAFAAQQGFYVGGNVNKYYTLGEYINKKTNANQEMTNVGLENVVYVDAENNGFTVRELVNEGSINKALREIEKGDLKAEYVNAADGSLVKPEEGQEAEQGELKVESVSAINATQVEVKFSAAVDKASLFATGTSGSFIGGATVTFSSLETPAISDGGLTGKLSADGKTLTVTAANALSKRYDVVVDGLKSTDGKDIVKYEEMITIAADKTAPTILGVEKLTATTVKVKFSEPLKAFNAITYKLADGSAVTGITGSIAAGDNEVVLTMADPAPVGKDIVATFVGVQDQAGNLLTPNPATAIFQRGDKDGVAPTVSSITQTGSTKFTIKFSEAIQTPVVADFSVSGTTVSKVEKVGEDATTFEITTAGVLDGLVTVATASGKTITDLSGETATFSNVVTFKKDTVAPKATAKLVTDKNNKEVIELTFDKDVTVGNVAVAGKQVEDFVTTTIASTTVAAVHPDANNKKVLHIPLSTGVLAVEGAEYDLKITSTAVKSDAGIAMEEVKVQFTRGKDDAAANIHVVTNVIVAQDASDNNLVTATFTIPSGTSLDGATATNVANYVIAGAEVESVTLAAASGTSQVATVKLKEDSNTFTGVRNITVKNVKVAGSTKVMEPVTKTAVSLKENVRPTLTKSEVTAITEGTTGTALVPAVPAVVSNVVLDSGATGTGTPVVTLNSSVYNSGTSDKAAITGVELEYDGSAWKSNTSGVEDSDIISVTGLTGETTGDKVTFDLSAYTAEIPAVPAVPASTEVTLTFSEDVVPGTAADFELFIDNAKVTATVATTAGTNANELKVTIDKALTATDFAKGVQLKAATTLDIADSVGNLLKLDSPIDLKLN